jgi:hypothetical protein
MAAVPKRHANHDTPHHRRRRRPPGNSVCVFVHGFEPYFFVECPQHWVPEHYEELREALRVGGAGRGGAGRGGRLCR